ncbi:MAG: GNAT family N-acetyltransferase [Phycisphaerae bacterium]|nr:GNAT family N-acetyltransferase [Phycisphaerae bacterium]
MSEFEPLRASDLDQVLPHLLATSGGDKPARGRPLKSFYDYLAAGTLEWQGLRSGSAAAPSGLFFAVLLPGATAIVMIPAPGVGGIDPADQLAITVAGLAELRHRRLHYAQALLEPEAAAKCELLEQAGFRPLAPLIYLERGASYPRVDPPAAHEAEWISYGAGSRAKFAEVVLATYHESRDCPELAGLRPIDDILASHQASGHFDPRLWELARVAGRSAGCLLLSRLAEGDLLEIVYMGVVPAYRRQGVGTLLLLRALEQCRHVGVPRLTVVVDERNDPAKRLYNRFAFTPVSKRDAYLYRWSWQSEL